MVGRWVQRGEENTPRASEHTNQTPKNNNRRHIVERVGGWVGGWVGGLGHRVYYCFPFRFLRSVDCCSLSL